MEQIQLQSAGIYSLSGAWSIHTVPALEKAASPLFQQNSPTQLELSEITELDSAALALITLWQAEYPGLELLHIPPKMQQLAHAFDVWTK